MRTVLITILVLFLAISAKSQLLGSIKMDPDELLLPAFSSDSTNILKEAIKSGVFISRQSFQIRDRISGKLYGLNGKNEFGIEYSIGIKVPDGFLLTDKAVRPWLYNSMYGKYKGKYDPVFLQPKFSEIGDSLKYDTLDYELSKQESVIDTAVYRFFSQNFKGDGFVLDTTNGKKKGWLIWITSQQNIDYEKSAKFDYIIERKEIFINKDHQSFEVESPQTEQNVLCGIYVVPVYTKIGVIEFRLCGIVVPEIDTWKIGCPFVESKEDTESTPNDSRTQVEQPDELTPIENSDAEKVKEKKNKKNKRIKDGK